MDWQIAGPMGLRAEGAELSVRGARSKLFHVRVSLVSFLSCCSHCNLKTRGAFLERCLFLYLWVCFALGLVTVVLLVYACIFQPSTHQISHQGKARHVLTTK